MRILAIVDFGLNEKTGGYKRNYEVIKRLIKKEKVTILPSIRNVKLLKYRKDLIKLLENLNSTPSNVLDLLERDVSVEEFVNSLRKDSYDVSMVYSNSSENIELARKITSAPIGVQLQLEPFYKDLSIIFKIMFRGITCRSITRFKKAMEESKAEEYKWKRLINEGFINFITSVSKTPLTNSGLDKLLPVYITRPGNAFDEELLHFRTNSKEDYAVYFTRLMPEKGLFEVPLIWKRLNKDNLRLYVIGNFVYEEDKEYFEKLVRRLNINVEYIGFKENEELYKIVSKAKFTLYPSHYDSFSLVILESLALGTPVFAYSTPAIREIYNGIKGVYLAEEDNINQLVNLIKEFETEEEVPIPYYFASWDKVVDSELNDIRRGAMVI